LDIGFFARYADASAIGSCAPLPSAFVNGMFTYVYREHIATEDAGLGLFAGAAARQLGALFKISFLKRSIFRTSHMIPKFTHV
jgi:hypothetical protein